MFALFNTGARILQEEVALRACDIVYVYGYGFPRYRGAPMFCADTVGLDKVHASVKRFHEAHGEWGTPARLLERLAKEGGKSNQ